MSFTDVLKQIFSALLKPFEAIFGSKSYQNEALKLLETSAGNVVLGIVQSLEGSDLSSDTLRGIALGKAVTILATQGVTLATSELDLLISTAVNYNKGSLGDKKIEVKPEVLSVVQQVVPKL